MMIHLQLCRIVEQNCATICQSPCMSWPSVSYDHHDHDPRPSFFIATFIIISLHVFSSMINTIPIICIWPAPEDDEQGSLPSSHEFFVPTMTELSKTKSGNPWQQHFVHYSHTVKWGLQIQVTRCSTLLSPHGGLVAEKWFVMVAEWGSVDAKTGWKNPITAHKMRLATWRLKDCKTASKMKKSGRSRNILTRTPRRREYLYLVGRADGDSPRVGRVVECHVEVTDLWGFKGRICEGGRPTLCEFVHTTSRHFRSEY